MSTRSRVVDASAVLLMTLAALQSVAADAQRPIPAAGPPPVVSLPANVKYELPNGLNVTLVPFGTVPKTTIVVTVATGAIADGAKPGLASLAAELSKQGVRGRSATELFQQAADLGGAVSVSAGIDSFAVSIDVLSEHAAEAIGLLGDILRSPTLPESELGRLKADMKRSITIGRAQQQGIASEAFAQLLFANGPRGRRVVETDVDAITYQDIADFLGRQLSARRARLYLAGRYDERTVKTAIESAFGTWQAGEPPLVDQSRAASAHIVQLIDRPGAKQSTILIGLPLPSITTPGYSDLSAANAVLGGSGLMSRLDRNLREDKGWTYGVQTQIDPLSDSSLWMLFADVNTPDTPAALKEIYREMTRLAAESLDPEELERIRRYRAGHFLMGASSRSGLIGQLQFVDYHTLGPNWLAGYLQRLQAVTPGGVQRAAALFDPSRMTVVVAGDLSRIKSGIEGLDALKGADFHSSSTHF